MTVKIIKEKCNLVSLLYFSLNELMTCPDSFPRTYSVRKEGTYSRPLGTCGQEMTLKKKEGGERERWESQSRIFPIWLGCDDSGQWARGGGEAGKGNCKGRGICRHCYLRKCWWKCHGSEREAVVSVVGGMQLCMKTVPSGTSCLSCFSGQQYLNNICGCTAFQRRKPQG